MDAASSRSTVPQTRKKPAICASDVSEVSHVSRASQNKTQPGATSPHHAKRVLGTPRLRSTIWGHEARQCPAPYPHGPALYGLDLFYELIDFQADAARPTLFFVLMCWRKTPE